MRNIEIKAKVSNIGDLLEKAKIISQSVSSIILQHDTFFKTDEGRLKLRKFEEGNAELIYYERPDVEGPKVSNYDKCDVKSTNVDGIAKVLSRALGITGIVEKKRHLFIIGNTRLHVDSVKDLGDFMELEVVLNDNQSIEDGEHIAEDLMKQLGIQKEDLISGAYTDMLNK